MPAVGEHALRLREVAAEHGAQHRVEEQHRLTAQGAIRAAGLEEHDRGAGEPAQLDLAGDELHELLPRGDVRQSTGVHAVLSA
ncbi:MAG: hypothetical protein R3C32_09505 [Chloroflexota bacterium]